MLTHDDLQDLGLDAAAAPSAPAQEQGQVWSPRELVPGSAAAVALASVWSGAPVTLVDAPPGSGKTYAIETILSHLSTRTALTLRVVCPTREQCLSMSLRLRDALPPGSVQLLMSRVSPDAVGGDAELSALTTSTDQNRVRVQTVAAAKMMVPDTDVLIVDEAYQATFADVATAAAGASQILLVGDPGQIGPVIAVDTSEWESLSQAPHHRAPEVFGRRGDARRAMIDTTFRLGPVTTAAIAPLYDFPFTSARPPRALIARDGSHVPEVVSLPLGVVDAVDDVPKLSALTQRVQDLLAHRLMEDGTDRAMTASDIAVVVAHNSQAGLVTGMLAASGLTDVVVGTADKLQGGQWHAVVALDPVTGVSDVTGHHTSLGRLCVMTSRHRTHLTWVHASGWQSKLSASGLDARTVDKGVRVRQALTAQEWS